MAVLDTDGRVEVNLLSSQVSAHAPFGGVVPELASREHLRALPLLARRAVDEVSGAVELVVLLDVASWHRGGEMAALTC